MFNFIEYCLSGTSVEELKKRIRLLEEDLNKA